MFPASEFDIRPDRTHRSRQSSRAHVTGSRPNQEAVRKLILVSHLCDSAGDLTVEIC
jgi:hypothetical protein